ncbi:GNAT family N-acetyltransferase [Paenibacillus sp. FSL H8-0548]|uniref:GNAT family N-acetyltransferase n=1 Tax=Paenibacillus sp. FSL H8-0548 TaxID=1920422 RepID=UPI0009FB5D67|nr:GNAT family N-acetyltransferase [Paenibacillus sp. FSL H8-0548]
MTNHQGSKHYKRNPLEMTICPMNPLHAQEICSWTYESPYHIYNWPAWEHMQKDGIEFGDPVLRAAQYTAVIDNQQQLIGYAQFFPIAGVTRLGLGIIPALCGQGLGPAFTRLIVAEARRRAPENEIDLEVLTWNTRAVRTYEQAGFHIADTYPHPKSDLCSDCYCMVYEPSEHHRG